MGNGLLPLWVLGWLLSVVQGRHLPLLLAGRLFLAHRGERVAGAGWAWRGQGRPEGVAERREYRTAGRNGPPLTLEGPGC
jgi:hypothetical protein